MYQRHTSIIRVDIYRWWISINVSFVKAARPWYNVLFCSELVLTALQYTVLHCTALHCTAGLCTVVHCSVVLADYCSWQPGSQGTLIIPTPTALHLLYRNVLHCTVLHCTVLYCTVLYFIGNVFPALHCTDCTTISYTELYCNNVLNPLPQ